MTLATPGLERDAIEAATRGWVERAVIGLNLCPFAKAAYSTDRVRFTVSGASTSEELRQDLIDELHLLTLAPAATIETTLLIHPAFLADFADFNAFLGTAAGVLQALDLVGVIQVASFHPAYQFADTTPDDITNCTNRSPYPILHLLREASIESAVAHFPDTETIYERNVATMRQLGAAGWAALVTRSPASASPPT
jgi:hypothetical protein